MSLLLILGGFKVTFNFVQLVYSTCGRSQNVPCMHTLLDTYTVFVNIALCRDIFVCNNKNNTGFVFVGGRMRANVLIYLLINYGSYRNQLNKKFNNGKTRVHYKKNNLCIYYHTPRFGSQLCSCNLVISNVVEVEVIKDLFCGIWKFG